MDLTKPHPTLATTIRHLDAEGKTHLLPPALWELLDAVNPESPHYNDAHAESITKGLDSLMHDFYEDTLGPNRYTQITAQQLSTIYNDFSKGMMYAAKHFDQTDEKSDIHRISMLGFTSPPAETPHAYGFATDEGMTVGIYPRLVSMYLSQYNLRKRGQLPGEGRVYEDHKIPGMYFNAREVIILTGIEEACHAQQMLKGRYKHEYDLASGLKEDAYRNAECEKEAEALQQAAVKKLGLGASTPDPEVSSRRSDTVKSTANLQHHPSRRRFLQAGGGLLLLGAAGALIKSCNPEKLDNPDLVVPPPPNNPRTSRNNKDYNKAYQEAYAALETSISSAAGDIVKESGKFDLNDLGKSLRFDVTVIPSQGRLQGAMNYRVGNDPENRRGRLPNFNRMLSACLDIAVLDQETHIAKSNKALDYDKVATKIAHHLQKAAFIPDPKWLKGELRNMLEGITETSVPFVIRPDKTPSHEKTFLVSGKTLHFTVMNPLLPENQKLAGQINSGRLDR